MRHYLLFITAAFSSAFGQLETASLPLSESLQPPQATPARVTTEVQIEVLTSPQDSTAIAASWQAATRHRLAFTANFTPLNLSRGVYTAAEYCSLVRALVDANGMEIYSVTDSLDYVRRKRLPAEDAPNTDASLRVITGTGDLVPPDKKAAKDLPVVEITAEIGSVNIGKTHSAGLDILAAMDDARTGNVPASGGWFFGGGQALNTTGASVATTAQPISRYLKLLDQDTDYHSISRPRMQCASGETASISTGSRVAVPSTSLTSNFGGPSTSSTITYQNVALSLEVTPVILDSGRISLQIQQTDNSISGSQIISGNTVPTIASQTFSTKTVVKSGELIALGGIRTDHQSHTTKGPRGLARLPLIGRLFRVDGGEKTSSELLILISVRVLK